VLEVLFLPLSTIFYILFIFYFMT